MAKEKSGEVPGMPGIVRPENLWGRPLPQKMAERNEARTKDSSTMFVFEEDEDAEDLRALVDDLKPIEDLDNPSDEELQQLSASADYDDDDDDEFGAEDGDDDDTSLVDETDDVVMDDTESEITNSAAAVAKEKAVSAPKKEKSRKMAEKVSISEHIRREIQSRKAAGDSLRGVDIRNHLADQGVTASAAQISQLLKKEGVAPAARGTRKNKDAAKAVLAGPAAAEKPRKRAGRTPSPRPPARTHAQASKPAATDGHFNFPIEKLKAADTFVNACGGLEEAHRILNIAVQISNHG